MQPPSSKISYFKQKHSKNNREKLDNRALNPDKTQYIFKLILLGDISVGKTAILQRFTSNIFNEEYHCTLGIEFTLKTIKLSDSISADLTIWDTCGEEKYRTITKQYFRDVKGVILVFDLTELSTFEKLNGWLNDLNENAPENVKVILIGNKMDLKEKRKVQMDKINNFIDKRGKQMEYLETSAKTGENIEDAFKKITERLIEESKEKEGMEIKETNEIYIRKLNEDDAKSEQSEIRGRKCC